MQAIGLDSSLLSQSKIELRKRNNRSNHFTTTQPPQKTKKKGAKN